MHSLLIMSYIYVIKTRDGELFKIGKASDPVKRISYLSRLYDLVYESFDIFDMGSDNAAYALESLLKSVLSEYQRPQPYTAGTEFFDIGAIDMTLEWLKKLDGQSAFSHETVSIDREGLCDKVDNVGLLLNGLGIMVRSKRLECGYTQGELAKICGIGKRTLERLEGGETTQISNALAVLSVLGLNIVDSSDVPAIAVDNRRVYKPRSPKPFVGDCDHTKYD